MARQRHYVNYGQSQDTVFFTTTCLDFVHVFKSPKLADIMTASLLSDCRCYQSLLWAFVVMPHHLHMLANVPEGMTAQSFMNRIKSNSARRLRPLITSSMEERFAHQTGLNKRVFWQRSFRSYIVRSKYELDQKMNYIHTNPVRAGLVCEAGDYRWSSALMTEQELRTVDFAIDITDTLIARYATEDDLRFGR